MGVLTELLRKWFEPPRERKEHCEVCSGPDKKKKKNVDRYRAVHNLGKKDLPCRVRDVCDDCYLKGMERDGNRDNYRKKCKCGQYPHEDGREEPDGVLNPTN